MPGLRANVSRPLGIAAVVWVAYGGLYLAVSLVTTFGGAGGTTFWPAAGITLAALLLRPRREWPMLLAGVWLIEFALDLGVSDVSALVSGGWATANIVEPLIGASLIRGRDPRVHRLDRAEEIIRFVAFGVLIGPAVGAALGVLAGVADGFYAFIPAFPRWFVGDAVGALVLAPAIITLLERHPRDRAGSVGSALLAGATTGVVVCAPWNFDAQPAFAFIAVPLLVFIALRTDRGSGFAAVAALAFVVNFMTAAGWGPFALEDEIVGLIEAQTYLAAVAFITFVTSALTADLVSRRQLDEAKDMFLQTVAHDLRNPLASIAGLAETLAERTDAIPESDRALMVERIGSTARRSIEVLGTFLDLDRLRSGEHAPMPVPTDLAALMTTLTRAIQADGHPIHVEIPPLRVTLDPSETERIIENLVVNAIKHTKDGTPIWIRASTADEGIILIVEDAGSGIPDEIKGHIFEPFYTGREGVSTGVGLHLVATYAERAGGTVWVEDRIGGGASFRVHLPQAVIEGSPYDGRA